MYDPDMLKMTVEIVKATVGSAGEKSMTTVNNPEAVAAYIQAVYGKLKEINDSIES